MEPRPLTRGALLAGRVGALAQQQVHHGWGAGHLQRRLAFPVALLGVPSVPQQQLHHLQSSNGSEPPHQRIAPASGGGLIGRGWQRRASLEPGTHPGLHLPCAAPPAHDELSAWQGQWWEFRGKRFIWGGGDYRIEEMKTKLLQEGLFHFREQTPPSSPC